MHTYTCKLGELALIVHIPVRGPVADVEDDKRNRKQNATDDVDHERFVAAHLPPVPLRLTRSEVDWRFGHRHLHRLTAV